jgi:hypothetical protein
VPRWSRRSGWTGGLETVAGPTVHRGFESPRFAEPNPGDCLEIWSACDRLAAAAGASGTQSVTSTPSPHRTGAAPEPGTCPVTTDSAIRRHVWTLSQRPLACEERGVGRSGRRKRAVVRDGDTAAANSIAANCDHCTRDWALGEPWCPMVSTRPHGSCPPVMIGDLSAVCQHKSRKRAYWHGTNTAGLGKVVGSTTGHADVASAARTAWATLSAGLAKRLCARCLGAWVSNNGSQQARPIKPVCGPASDPRL